MRVSSAYRYEHGSTHVNLNYLSHYDSAPIILKTFQLFNLPTEMYLRSWRKYKVYNLGSKSLTKLQQYTVLNECMYSYRPKRTCCHRNCYIIPPIGMKSTVKFFVDQFFRTYAHWNQLVEFNKLSAGINSSFICTRNYDNVNRSHS